MFVLFLVINITADVENPNIDKLSDEVLQEVYENNEVDIIIELKQPEDLGDVDSIEEKRELIKEKQEQVLENLNESIDSGAVVVADDDDDGSGYSVDDSTDESDVESGVESGVESYVDSDSGVSLDSSSSEPQFILEDQLEDLPLVGGVANEQAIAELITDPDVEAVHLNHKVSIHLDASIPIIHAPDVWSRKVNGVNITGAGQTVCVIDTGIYSNHTNLGGAFGVRVLAGKNTITDTVCSAVNGECDDDNGHGTHVAGTIISNHSTYKGVAPGASVVAIRALADIGGGLGGDADGDILDVGDGISWCVTNKDVYNISVISMSLGTSTLYTSATCITDIDSAIDSAYDANITLVASSGNADSTTGIGYPACNTKVISVGASNDNDALWSLGGGSGTNRNSDLDILAPGVGIVSTYPSSIIATSSKTGTSMAAPHVAGVVALLRQDQLERDGKNLTVGEIETLITITNFSISGYPRLDAYLLIVPNISFVDPTPNNNSYTDLDYVYVNVTTTRIVTSASLDINGTNYTMTANSDNNNFYMNVTGLNGLHNYTVYVNDSSLTLFSSLERFYKINNTEPDITSYVPTSAQLSVYETNSILFNHTSKDNNSDSLNYYWYLEDKLQPTSTGVDKNWTFTPNQTQAGVYNVSLIITDGYENDTVSWNLSVLNFAAPNMTLIENISVNVDEDTNATVNITVVAVDDPGDTLYYSINMSNFTQFSNVFLWNVTYHDTGTYYVNVSVNDSNLSSSQIVMVIVGDITDSDGDGTYDVLDTDDDNDGILDTIDYLTGNISSINATSSSGGGGGGTSINVSLLINGSTNLIQTFENNINITIKIDANITVEVVTNITEQNINLYNLTLNKQNSSSSRGFLIVKGLTLSTDVTKTVYVDDINASFNTVCVKDADVNNISQISAGCNGANERLVTCDGTDTTYNCSRVDNNTRYKITGLSHSAIYEQCADNDGDGYGASCPLGTDCNDNSASIHSGCGSDDGGGSGGGGSQSSSDSGGGGIAVEPEEDATKKYTYQKLKKGEKRTINIDSDILPITKLSFTVDEQVSSVTLAAKSYKEQPKKVKTSAPNVVYKYMGIEGASIGEVSGVLINFKVNKSYIQDNDLDISTIYLYLYDSDSKSWSKKSVKSTGEDFYYYYYASSFDDFGYLAISMKKNVEITVEEASEEEMIDITGDVVEDVEEVERFPWHVIVISVLLAGALVVVLKRRLSKNK